MDARKLNAELFEKNTSKQSKIRTLSQRIVELLETKDHMKTEIETLKQQILEKDNKIMKHVDDKLKKTHKMKEKDEENAKREEKEKKNKEILKKEKEDLKVKVEETIERKRKFEVDVEHFEEEKKRIKLHLEEANDAILQKIKEDHHELLSKKEEEIKDKVKVILRQKTNLKILLDNVNKLKVKT